MTNPSSFFLTSSGMMKCTLFVTQRCNLACDYCYIAKKNAVMPMPIAQRILDFIFANVKKDETLEIGFFGGEPMLEFDRVKEITALIQDHPGFDPKRVTISLVTNGTILTDEVLDFLLEKRVVLCISCDGPPDVQDAHRRFRDGRGSSSLVESSIRRAVERFPLLPVNAVYTPENLRRLPTVVEYLTSIGVRNIYLNPDISAHWTQVEAEMLPEIYSAIGRMYVDHYARGEPKYISLIDGKIALILRGGYKANERCRMGSGEFAFAPSGNIYPCERLVGPDDGISHCIGNIQKEFVPGRTCKAISCSAINPECGGCGIKDYCMNWCGCTNYHSTGRYDVVSPFICASERAAIEVALHVIGEMNRNNSGLSHHLVGSPLINISADIIEKG
jgi:uncharacterized protein